MFLQKISHKFLFFFAVVSYLLQFIEADALSTELFPSRVAYSQTSNKTNDDSKNIFVKCCNFSIDQLPEQLQQEINAGTLITDITNIQIQTVKNDDYKVYFLVSEEIQNNTCPIEEIIVSSYVSDSNQNNSVSFHTYSIQNLYTDTLFIYLKTRFNISYQERVQITNLFRQFYLPKDDQYVIFNQFYRIRYILLNNIVYEYTDSVGRYPKLLDSFLTYAVFQEVTAIEMVNTTYVPANSGCQQNCTKMYFLVWFLIKDSPGVQGNNTLYIQDLNIFNINFNGIIQQKKMNHTIFYIQTITNLTIIDLFINNSNFNSTSNVFTLRQNQTANYLYINNITSLNNNFNDSAILTSYMRFTNITFENSKFLNNSIKQFNYLLYGQMYFIEFICSNTIKINNLLMDGIIMQTTNIFAFLNSTNLTIFNSSFSNLQLTKQSGQPTIFIYINSSQTLLINFTKFINNSLISTWDARIIFFDFISDIRNLSLIYSTFYNNSQNTPLINIATEGTVATRMNSPQYIDLIIFMANCTFTLNTNQVQVNIYSTNPTGLIRFTDLSSIQINLQFNVFKNNTNFNPQALSYNKFAFGLISITRVLGVKYSTANIINNVFEYNKANFGGALFFQGIMGFTTLSVPQLNSNIFRNNYAMYGGAIYYSATEVPVNAAGFTLNVNTFENNYAEFDGGAIYFSGQNLFVQGGLFMNNSAQRGGAVYMYLLIYQSGQQCKSAVFQSQIVFKNNIAYQGGLLYYEQSSQSNKTCEHPSFNRVSAYENQAVIGGLARLVGLQQRNMQDLQICKNTQELLSNNSEYNNIYNNTSINDQLLVQCKCSYGEKYSEFTGGCEQCPVGLYQFQLDGLRTDCLQCPEHVECPGGYDLLRTQEGYWRENQISNQIIYCKNNPKSCAGNDTCYTGYIGVLCQVCDIDLGYEKVGNFKCSKCLSQGIVVVIIFAVTIFIVGYLLFSVKSYFDLVQQQTKIKILKQIFNFFINKQNRMTQLLKITVNYFQIISIIGSFQIKFPQIVENVTSVIGDPINGITFSGNCLFGAYYDGFPHSYLKIIWEYVAFIAQTGLMSTYFAIVLYNDRTYKFKFRFLTGLIVMFLYVQPGVIMYTIQMIACITVGDTSYIQGDLSRQCENSSYNHYNYLLTYPSLLLSVVIIPLILVVYIYRHQKSQKRYSLRSEYIYTLGYLCKGYKKNRYYWEFARMFQRILIIILIQVYYDEIIIKGVLAFLIVFIYNIIQMKLKPHESLHLDRIESFSSYVQQITILIGVFMYQNIHQYLEDMSFWLIVILNFGFISYLVFVKLIPEFVSSNQTNIFKLSQKVQIFQKCLQNPQKQKRQRQIQAYLREVTLKFVKKQKKIKSDCKNPLQFQDFLLTLDFLQIQARQQTLINYKQQENNSFESGSKDSLDIENLRNDDQNQANFRNSQKKLNIQSNISSGSLYEEQQAQQEITIIEETKQK